MKRVLILPLIIGIYFFIPLPRKLPTKVEDSVRIVDRNGNLLRMLPNQTGGFNQFISLEKVPEKLIHFILMAEDKRYYTHQGVDWQGLARAAWQNLVHLKIISGASTIDQQVARILGGYSRSWYYKPLVMLDALKLNFTYFKSQILEYYLNHIPYGHRIVGIKEAAHYLFNKELETLTQDEMATLAVIPRSPSRLLRNSKQLVRTRNLLLHQMQLLPSETDNVVFDFSRRLKSAPHFLRYLLKTGERLEREVKTSLDLALQQDLQLIVKEEIELLNKKNVGAAAALVVENKTGEILSYIGSHDFFASNGGEIDGIWQKRQPGSALKPFTYALAFQSDHHTSSILPDIETSFNVGGGVYRPKNYSSQYLGPVRASFALANSLNIPALYLANYYTPQVLLEYLNSFDLHFDHPSEYYGVGLTLGNAEVDLYHLVQAYTSFAGEGYLTKLTPFRGSESVKVKTKLDSQTAQLISLILQENERREHSFGRWNNLNLPFQISAKTGTSSNFRDNWVVGFNQYYTIGVWVGNFNNHQMTNVSGITGAGKLFYEIAKTVQKKYPTPFKDYHLVKKTICALSGKIAGEYCDHTLAESFTASNFPTQECDIHKTVLVRSCHEFGKTQTIKVSDIDHLESFWKKYTEFEPLEEQIANICSGKFQIVRSYHSKQKRIDFKTPLEGAFYGIDPIIPRDQQKLTFELDANVPIKSIQWELNETILGESKEHFDWMLSRGKKSLKATITTKDGSKLVKEVNFYVL